MHMAYVFFKSVTQRLGGRWLCLTCEIVRKVE